MTRIFGGENDLEQMSIDELEILHRQLKESVDEKKNKLFKQIIIDKRLSERLDQIYKIIEQKEEKIRNFLKNDDQQLQTSGDLVDECVKRWNEEKEKINRKFDLIDQLLNELDN